MPRMITRLVLESNVSQAQKIAASAIGSGINRTQRSTYICGLTIAADEGDSGFENEQWRR